MRRYLLSVLLLVTFTSLGFSQGGNSQLGGTVTDPSGALIPGVTITVTNTETGVTSTAITNESGAYNFPSLQPGRAYRAAASLPGFQTQAVNNLELSGATSHRQNFQLSLATAATTVEVVSDASAAITAAGASVGDVLPEQRIQSLPLVSNNILDLLDILPGFRVGPPGAFGANTNDTVAGLGMNSVNVTQDGLTLSDYRYDPQSWGRGVMAPTTINPDLVGEIRLILTPVDAEIGRGNGQIQIQTRSGTNRYTGAAVWSIRNSALDANSWSNNLNTTGGVWDPIEPDWRNTHQYTLSFGGPILRDKTFFYVLWDQNISNTRSRETPTVLTDTARLGIFRYWQGWNPDDYLADVTSTGNNPTRPSVDDAGRPVAPPTFPNGSAYTGSLRCFSVFGNMRLNDEGSLVPFTNSDCQFGSVVGQAVTGPSAGGPWDTRRTTVDSTGFIRKILTEMPRANFFGGGDGLNTAQHAWVRGRSGNNSALAPRGGDPFVNRKQINIKIDQNFRQHRISGSWTTQFDSSDDLISAWPGGLSGTVSRRPHVVTVNVTSTLSSSLLNEARFGMNRNQTDRAPAFLHPNAEIRSQAEELITLQGGANPLTGENYKVVINPGLGTGNSSIGNGAMSVGNHIIGSTLVGNVSPLYNYADTVSWTRGAHALKFGGELRLPRSRGWNQNPLPIATLGSAGAAGTPSPFSSTSNFATELPGFPSNARGTATNLLYWLNGSVNTVNNPYWIVNNQDIVNAADPNYPLRGWQDYLTTGEYRIREQVGKEWAFFVKDDWKVTRNLTLNLGLRWEYYAPTYLADGFTAAAVGQGEGLWGPGRGSGQDRFNTWLSPGNLFLAGYGGTAVNPNPYACLQGVQQSPLLPASTCDPSQLMQVEFIGPDSPNPDKIAWPADKDNFGPAVGFSWQLPWFGEGKTTVRGGYQITYGSASRNGIAIDQILGSSPNSSITQGTSYSDSDVQAILAQRALNLSDIPLLTPARVSRGPGAPLPVYNRSLSYTQFGPDSVTPYTQNFNLSVTRSLNRSMTVDVRYVGTMAKKQQGGLNLNTPNVYHNPELLEALEVTRSGGDAPLFDQMLAGLNLAGASGYGAVGTVVGGRLQTGSAHLRRSTTFAANLANGNYVGVVNSLIGLSTSSGLRPLPIDPQTGQTISGVSQRVLRNGCDRIADGLYNPALPASPTNIATRCFPEDYIISNPQLNGATYNANLGYNTYHSMQAQFSLRPTHGISFQSTYTWAKSIGLEANTAWSDPLNRNANYRPSTAGAHDLRLNGTFELPVGPNKLLLGNSSGWAARLLERWQTSVILNLSSASYASVGGAGALTYGTNRFDVVSPLWQIPEGDVRWDRPTDNGPRGSFFGGESPFFSVDDPQCSTVVGATDSMGYNLQNNCTLDALAMIVPAGTPGALVRAGDGASYVIALQNPLPGKIGTLGERNIPSLGSFRLDANMSKTFRVTESKTLQLRVDATNVLNHPEPTTTISNTLNTFTVTTFGNINSKTGSRDLRGSLRLTF